MQAEGFSGERGRSASYSTKALLASHPSGRFSTTALTASWRWARKCWTGELEYHKGNHELAFSHLQEAVDRDDNLEYVEPWAWMHPPRHALAALLAEQGRYAEAEQIYRDDLGMTNRIQRCSQHPDNVWALRGLAECLELRAESVELASVLTKLGGCDSFG